MPNMAAGMFVKHRHKKLYYTKPDSINQMYYIAANLYITISRCLLASCL